MDAAIREIAMKNGKIGAADLVADPIACRNNADFSCIRATICFAAATVCV